MYYSLNYSVAEVFITDELNVDETQSEVEICAIMSTSSFTEVDIAVTLATKSIKEGGKYIRYN